MTLINEERNIIEVTSHTASFKFMSFQKGILLNIFRLFKIICFLNKRLLEMYSKEIGIWINMDT